MANLWKRFFILIAIVGMASCGKDCPDPTVLSIAATYSNEVDASGNHPVLRIKSISPSEYTNIVFDKDILGYDSLVEAIVNGKDTLVNRIFVPINDFSIYKDNQGYEVKSIRTFEKKANGSVVEDKENKLTSSKNSSLDVVLVLDVSSSLGTDITTVKEQAKSFIRNIQNSNSQNFERSYGVVCFSKFVNALPLTKSVAQVESFINSATGIDETFLFGATSSGLDLLLSSKARNKVIVVFTDGANNYWGNDLNFRTKDYIVNRLKDFGKGNNLSVFSIGYKGKGNIDEGEVRSLAYNGNSYFPSDKNGIASTFDDIRRRINVSNSLVYDRNESFVPKADPIEVRFDVEFKAIQ